MHLTFVKNLSKVIKHTFSLNTCIYLNAQSLVCCSVYSYCLQWIVNIRIVNPQGVVSLVLSPSGKHPLQFNNSGCLHLLKALIVYYYTSLTCHWLKLNHMTWNNFNFLVKINPNGKQLVVYRVATLLFPGKQPIACLKRETTLSKFS